MDQPLAWLKYVDAGDIDDDPVDFDGMNVESPSGEHLGDVEGFVVDADSKRPYYVVVDAGGWFKSKHFLLPVGHVQLETDSDGEALVTALSRDRINKFPGFDIDAFEKMSAADLKRFNDETCAMCTTEGVVVAYGAGEPLSAAWDRTDFSYPDWWHAEPTLPDRMAESALTKGAEYSKTSGHDQGQESSHEQGQDRHHEQEQIVARADRTDRSETDRKGANTDTSPHFDGRAQPGDVLGIEAGGERTAVGDTREDEDKRRGDAQDAAANQN